MVVYTGGKYVLAVHIYWHFSKSVVYCRVSTFVGDFFLCYINRCFVDNSSHVLLSQHLHV